MIDYATFGPLLASVGLIVIMFAIFGQESRACRATAAALCIILALRYLWWHATLGMPKGQTLLQQLWAWTFFLFESMNNLSSMLVYFFLSRTKNRSPDADAARNSPLLAAPVDVFIVTFNEPASVLERTVVGAKAIDHPDLRVFVLDDGARDFVRDLAHELGANYIRRVKGKHAKAGNVNNGLSHALSTGRRPEFILLLDADFVPGVTILKRTLGLFREPDVGIVQTPQHFFNSDPIQSNLLCASAWPDEQRFFFEVLMPAKDAWGVAFCCGTSAVFRVAALLAAEGMATETVTEDMLTSFKMEEHGYRTIYLNEPLSMGLAPEDFQAYITQRSRWCLGAIQQSFTRWSFAGRSRLRLISRLSSFDGGVYWIFTFPFKVLMLTAPLVYWWTGTAVIEATGGNLIEWLAPTAVCGVIFMCFYARNRVLPVMTDVTQLLPSIVIMRTVIAGLTRPFGQPFKVTPKGSCGGGVTIQWSYLLPFAAAALMTFFGILINTSAYSELNGTPGFEVNVFWSIYNIAILLLAATVCVELPQQRLHSRFPAKEGAALRGTGGADISCTITDISLSGARIAGFLPAWAEEQGEGVLVLDSGALEVPFRFVRQADSREGGEGFGIVFEDGVPHRRALTSKLFTGSYRGTVAHISVPRVLFAVGRRLLR
ncbi:MAG: glycosyltransferase [Beijerinckiaceae bacterium]|nr:glycosyltransferase [Beijerinckiaceae bacterium]